MKEERVDTNQNKPEFELEQDASPTSEEQVESRENELAADAPASPMAQAEAAEPEAPVGQDEEPEEEAYYADAEATAEDAPFGTPLRTIESEGEFGFEGSIDYKVVNRSASTPFVFDFEDGVFLLSGSKAQRIETIRGYEGKVNYLADFPDAPSMGIVTVTGNYRYADVLARKLLEDQGDLNQDYHLWIYKKQRMETTQSRIFYNIFPRARYTSLMYNYEKMGRKFTLYDTLGLLYDMLHRLDRQKLHVLALHLGSSILMLAGHRDEIYMARRYTVLGRDDYSLAEAIRTLHGDIVGLEQASGERVGQINWIEGMTYDLEHPLPEMQIPVYAYPVSQLSMEGQLVYSALPAIMDRASSFRAITSEDERFVRPMESAEKYAWLAAAIVIVALIGGYWAYDINLKELSQTSQTLNRQVAELQRDVNAINLSLERFNPDEFLKTSGSLRQATLSPTYGEIWNLMAVLKTDVMRVDSMELSYTPEVMNVSLEGEMEVGLTQARSSFTDFLREVERLGFTVVNQGLNMNFDANTFSVTMQWPIVGSE